MDNLQSLFLSSQGRIGRQQFWIGTIILIVAGVVLSYILSALFGVSMFGANMMSFGQNGSVQIDSAAILGAMARAGWVSVIMTLLFAYPIANLMIKRRHDRNSSGIEVWIYIGVLLLSNLIQALGLGFTMNEMGGMQFPGPTLLSMGIGLVGLALGVYLLVVCGFLKGDAGENSYGPDPLGAK
ncbi:MAG: DUF805 domain-containing protein [Hyphomicrobiaceae bacterium]|nr:DUF805 domain-containing protein [Hyphomicrobiaceae bacterium]